MQIIKNKIFLRKATDEDAELLFNWRNDDEVREASFHQEILKWPEHLEWFKKVLNNSACCLYIINNQEGTPIGQIRFDKNGDGATINISLGKDFRGKGYGAESIKTASRFFLDNHKDIKKIMALVKDENESSVKVFNRSGFLECKRENGIINFLFNK